MTDTAPQGDAPASKPASKLLDLQEWIGYGCAVAAAYGAFGRPAALAVAAVVLVVTANMRAAATARHRKPRRFDRMVTAAASFIAAYRNAGGAT